jgi:AraC-like DNA-binding protein
LPKNERHEWLRTTISREYANVEITPPTDTELYSETTIYPWDALRLSAIRSNGITLQRQANDPYIFSQDCYFAVALLSGDYHLQQNGREAFLKPGDISIYDVTMAHQIRYPHKFSKLIVTIPRALLRDRIAGIEHCTALPISGNSGIGSVVSNFMLTSVNQVEQLNVQEFSAMSDYFLDLLILALASVRPVNFNLSRTRSMTLNRIKGFIKQHLSDAELNPAMVALRMGLSSRYINSLFNDADTSLMRYIWQRRLEHCRKDLQDPRHLGHSISDIAFRWSFNDLSHFSRSFKKQFACSPKQYRGAK